MRNLSKGQNRHGLLEFSSAMPKLRECGTYFGVTLLVLYLDTKETEGSYVKYMQLVTRILKILCEKEKQIQNIQKNIIK